MLLVDCCLLLTVVGLSIAVDCSMFRNGCASRAVRCSVFVVRCSLCVVCCS